MAGIAVRKRPIGAQNSVERRQETRLDAAAKEAMIEPRDDRCRSRLIRRLDAEHPEHRRREQRRGRPFACHIPQNEPERAGGQIDVIVEVAADRAAWDRGGRRRKERAGAIGRRQQRLLDRRDVAGRRQHQREEDSGFLR